MSKSKLEYGFDPIWRDDFKDLKTMSKTAFILRQLYRAYRDLNTDICTLSDYHVQRITHWNLETIRNARRELISGDRIVPQGYLMCSG